MPNRQWFCWNLCLKYSCGCSTTSSEHVCNEDRGVKWYIPPTYTPTYPNHLTSTAPFPLPFPLSHSILTHPSQATPGPPSASRPGCAGSTVNWTGVSLPRMKARRRGTGGLMAARISWSGSEARKGVVLLGWRGGDGLWEEGGMGGMGWRGRGGGESEWGG